MHDGDARVSAAADRIPGTRRFSDRGEGVEDIVQQGMIGLIYALDHFDPTRGVRFATFALSRLVASRESVTFCTPAVIVVITPEQGS